MSDLERLAKIEARHNSVTSEDRIGPKRHAQYVLLHEDMPWLLARVREREAQAEIAEAAVEWLKLAGWLGDWDEDGDAEVRAFTRLCQLAAFATREEGK